MLVVLHMHPERLKKHIDSINRQIGKDAPERLLEVGLRNGTKRRKRQKEYEEERRGDLRREREEESMQNSEEDYRRGGKRTKVELRREAEKEE